MTEAPPDVELVDAITRAFVGSPHLDSTAIHVTVTSGRATLRGTVATHAERLAAAARATAVPGVTGVDNELRIRDLDLPGTTLADDEITEHLGRAILNSTVKVDDLRFGVDQHVATVHGHVATKRDKTALRHAVQNAPGVHFVDDRIEVGGRGTHDSIEELDPAECFRLLRSTSTGRLAVQDEAGVDIFPVTYLLHDDAIYFRSGPGTKLIRLADEPHVAFEADGHERRLAWSVVVRGVAERLDADDEIAASGIAEASSAHPREMLNYVRIRPQQISGRRFRRRD